MCISCKQESMKVREVIHHIGPIPIEIPLKLFLDLLRDPVFPQGITDSQSYVPFFTIHCMRIRSAVNICKMGTYDWLSVNPRGNTGTRWRSKNNLRAITMEIESI